jgi:transcriptional regulator with XRE-family HTH domain
MNLHTELTPDLAAPGRHDRLGPSTRASAKDPVDRHIGARLKLRRRMLGMSQSDLANELDVTYQQVCKYEAGDNRISAAKLFQAADVMSCPVAFFFEGLSRRTPLQAKSGSESAERALNQFLNRPDAMRMAGEFPKIRSRRLRRQLMRLVSVLAEDGAGNA